MAWNDFMSTINNENLTGNIGFGQLLTGTLTNTGRRPKYSPPGAATEGLGLARQLAFASVRPGNEQALIDINRVANQQAETLNRNLTSGTQVLAGMQGINQQQNRAIQQNNMLNANFKFNAFQNLQRTLQNYAQYQDKAWQQNQLMPYMYRVNTKAALVGSGLQNLNNWNNFKLQQSMWDKYLATPTATGQPM
jgi:hypothetical protein